MLQHVDRGIEVDFGSRPKSGNDLDFSPERTQPLGVMEAA